MLSISCPNGDSSILVGIGGGLAKYEAKSTRHAFSLQDPNISYPYHADTVTVSTLGLSPCLSKLVPRQLGFLT